MSVVSSPEGPIDRAKAEASLGSGFSGERGGFDVLAFGGCQLGAAAQCALTSDSLYYYVPDGHHKAKRMIS